MRIIFIFSTALLLCCKLAQAQERVWTLDAAGEDAFLVYGVPESEDVGISFWCKIGTDRITLYFPVPWTTLKPDDTQQVDVELGTAMFQLQGKTTSGETIGDSSIEAPLPTGDVFFNALKATDRIKLTMGTHKSVYPLQDIQVDGLLKLCRQPAETP